MKKEISIRRALLKWFRHHARDLPWRGTHNPYAIWLSEMMLQQTRVETVIPYYHNFLEKFPTVFDLARAKEDRVLKVWEGLGYYSRARNMHKTAKIIAKDHNGHFPKTAAELQLLPGIGPYSAGAIASIAFNEPVPAIDGNVKRVMARLYAIEESIALPQTLAQIETELKTIIAPRAPGDFNQALMELGARICLPKKPLCATCPVRNNCAAYSANIQERLPTKAAKKPVPHVQVVAAAIKRNGRYLIGKRPNSSMLAGLWEFPGGKIEQGETHHEALQREIEEELGIEINLKEHMVSVDHAYSHFKVTLHLYLCEHVKGTPQALYHSDLKWVFASHFHRYAFPTANTKFFPYL